MPGANYALEIDNPLLADRRFEGIFYGSNVLGTMPRKKTL